LRLRCSTQKRSRDSRAASRFRQENVGDPDAGANKERQDLRGSSGTDHDDIGIGITHSLGCAPDLSNEERSSQKADRSSGFVVARV
jgi:hypothetical protein